MLNINTAKNIVLSKVDLISKVQKVHVKHSINCVSVECIESQINIPAARTSTRDGYVWKTSWISKQAQLHPQKIYAGCDIIEETWGSTDQQITHYITTGGIVPDGFDAVIMVEDCSNVNGIIELKDFLVITKNQYIREIGSDVAKGQIIIGINATIHAFAQGLLLMCGIETIFVKRTKPLKIAVMSTGDEVIDVGQSISVGQVYDCNSHMISNRLSLVNATTINYGILPDDGCQIKKKLAACMEHFDIIITSGSTSMGEKDLLPNIINELQFQTHITKVNMMPGNPFLFATNDKTHTVFFGLAGNPVATQVALEVFVQPFIWAAYNINDSLYRTNRLHSLVCNYPIIAGDENIINRDQARPHFLRTLFTLNVVSNQLIAETSNSSNVSGLVGTDALLLFQPCETAYSSVEIDSSKIHLINPDVRYFDKNCPLIAVIVTSDRASQGIYKDKSGEGILAWCKQNFVSKYQIEIKIIPDDELLIEATIKYFALNGASLILTTGGTGPASRDVTAEVTRKCIDKELPGFGEQMRQVSLKYVPTAILSGQTAGVLYHPITKLGSTIINLPGSPKSISECLDAIKGAIPYCIELADGCILETEPPAFTGKRTFK